MQFLGHIFINCLKVIVLIFVIVIMTRTPMDMAELANAKTFATFVIGYYVLTTFLAALIGLALVNAVSPGTNVAGCSADGAVASVTTALPEVTLLDSVLNIFYQALPENIFKAITDNNILGILVIFLLVGFYMAKYSRTENGQAMKRILDLWYQTCLDLLDLVIAATPVGVFSLISGQVASIKNLCVFAELGVYIATFLAGFLGCLGFWIFWCFWGEE